MKDELTHVAGIEIDGKADLWRFAKLPEKPEGWTMRCEFHMSAESKCKKRYGTARYVFVAPDGKPIAIAKEYSTHPTEGFSAYRIDGLAKDFTKWAELVKAYPDARAAALSGIALDGRKEKA